MGVHHRQCSQTLLCLWDTMQHLAQTAEECFIELTMPRCIQCLGIHPRKATSGCQGSSCCSSSRCSGRKPSRLPEKQATWTMKIPRKQPKINSAHKPHEASSCQAQTTHLLCACLCRSLHLGIQHHPLQLLHTQSTQLLSWIAACSRCSYCWPPRRGSY